MVLKSVERISDCVMFANPLWHRQVVREQRWRIDDVDVVWHNYEACVDVALLLHISLFIVHQGGQRTENCPTFKLRVQLLVVQSVVVVLWHQFIDSSV